MWYFEKEESFTVKLHASNNDKSEYLWVKIHGYFSFIMPCYLNETKIISQLSYAYELHNK